MLLLAAGAVTAEPEWRGDEHSPFALSLPAEAYDFIGDPANEKAYAPNTSINPFYLHGNFITKGHRATALLIRQRTTGKPGIAIIESGSARARIVGAGRRVAEADEAAGDSLDWVRGWKVVAGAGGRDELLLCENDNSCATLRWDGRRLVLQSAN
jgi:hypothetical protein